MIDLDTAVSDYRRRTEYSNIAEYPLVWAGHYSQKLLGEYGVPVLPNLDEALGHVAFGVMGPFGFTQSIHSSYLVIDGACVPDYKRNLFVSRLTALNEGILTTHWVIPYTIADSGTVFGEPRKEPYYGPKVYAALSTVSDQRLTRPTYTFDEAYKACLVQLNEIMK